MNKGRIKIMVLEKLSGKLYDLIGFIFDSNIYYVAEPEDPYKTKTLRCEDFDMKFFREELGS